MDYGMKDKGPRTGGYKPTQEPLAAMTSTRPSRRGNMPPRRRGMEKGSELWPAPASMRGSSQMMVGEPTTSAVETMKYKG